MRKITAVLIVSFFLLPMLSALVKSLESKGANVVVASFSYRDPKTGEKYRNLEPRRA